MKNVELIASGYEWNCPECNRLNKEIEIKDHVKCPRCENIFEVINAEHAYC